MCARAGLTAGQVADLVGGELLGRADLRLAGVASLETAGPGDLSFLTSSRYLPYFHHSRASAVLLTPDFRDEGAGPATRIVVPNTRQALNQALAALYPEPSPPWGVDSTARIGRGTRWSGRIAIGAHATLGRNVELGRDCVVEPHALLEDGVRLGAACHIGPHAVVHSRTSLGKRVVLRAGAKVGGPGFGFEPTEHGHERTSHVGRCIIGDDVELGANTTVDRGSVADTVIGPGTKIDNLVQVGHNVRIGARCLVMAQVGISGSTIIEDDVILAGQAGLADHLRVGRGARVAAQGGVIGDVPAGATVSGYPARSHRSVLRQSAALSRLAPLVASLERLVERDGS